LKIRVVKKRLKYVFKVKNGVINGKRRVASDELGLHRVIADVMLFSHKCPKLRPTVNYIIKYWHILYCSQCEL
jgi:hypothetical protein